MAGMSREIHTQSLPSMAKKKPSKPKKVVKNIEPVFNDEQFEAHAMDSISNDIKKWNIPWFVGVIGKPHSDDIKIVVAGKNLGQNHELSQYFVKSILTMSAMSIEDLLNDKDAKYDFYDI